MADVLAVRPPGRSSGGRGRHPCRCRFTTSKKLRARAATSGSEGFSYCSGMNTRFDDVNTRFDNLRTELIDRIDTVKADLSAEIADVRTDLRRMDDRLRAVEIAFGKVDQRLETLERLHRPAPEPGASGI